MKQYTPGTWIKNTKHATYTGSGNVRAIMGGTYSTEVVCQLGEVQDKEDNADLISESKNLLSALEKAARIISRSKLPSRYPTLEEDISEINRLIEKLTPFQ